MKRAIWVLALVVWLVATPRPGVAHPVPFSYLDVHIGPAGLEMTLTAHIVDLAHELSIEPRLLLDSENARNYAQMMTGLLSERLKITADGAVAPGQWTLSEVLVDRQSVQFRGRVALPAAPGAVDVDASLFPYDPEHQTFVNFYEDGAITEQAILSRDRTSLGYVAGTRQGVITTVHRFIPAGFHHILIGPDHILFLVGLLLLGGPIRRLFTIVTAFTVAHSITLSLAALNIFAPPANIIEPAIALSIVYVGVDNLIGAEGRDVRPWIAFAFGFIHGFGFANVLAEMALPQRVLGWGLFAFNFGVELGQLLVVAIVASVFAALRARGESVSRKLVFAGSIAVAAAGAFWFVQRVFFSGGVS
ncbi:MAG TPA: HupE/UreJ family protein [Terriglobia bacterium]|nr:HupE/UreJ family protein [Terriglobia bacterium]